MWPVFSACSKSNAFSAADFAQDNPIRRNRSVLRTIAPGEVHCDCGQPKHQLPPVHLTGGHLADIAADVSDEDLLVPLGRLQREDSERLVRARRADEPNYSISESGQDVRVSTLTGRALAHKAGMTVNKSFSTAWRPVFEAKRFMELKNAQAIVLAYDGVNPFAASALLPRTVLPGPEHRLFRAASEETTMNGFEMILPYLRPIEYLIGNEEVSEIMVNCDGQVFAEKVGLIGLVPDRLCSGT